MQRLEIDSENMLLELELEIGDLVDLYLKIPQNKIYLVLDEMIDMHHLDEH